ncbi:O-acetyl-ADP-ribose deacetylase [Arthrobacter sp. H14]|uniref:O-acetyl-ADP-ribose deacetylase n=1 Tax=Arthrobacter sp. H14 TaxID=1312959 RepID=UPI00047AC696|nr:O-acetyl-ADP-ribose deacetylase [Arthrobacter sp. H14]
MATERLTVVTGDITRQDVDVIVNAANTSLLGGGGADGAIHAAAGPGLLAECRALNGCGYGEAKATGGHNLTANHVIHTVGPIYGCHHGREAELLANCYRNSLNLAEELQAEGIAFPGISTGVYGYPKEEAASIAVRTIREYFRSHQDSRIKEVRLVAFSDGDARILSAASSL